MIYLFVIPLLVINMILRGLLIKTTFEWFVLPHWHSAPNLGIMAWLGVAAFISAITPWWYNLNGSKSRDEVGMQLLSVSIFTSVALVIAFVGAAIIKSFI